MTKGWVSFLEMFCQVFTSAVYICCLGFSAFRFIFSMLNTHTEPFKNSWVAFLACFGLLSIRTLKQHTIRIQPFSILVVFCGLPRLLVLLGSPVCSFFFQPNSYISQHLSSLSDRSVLFFLWWDCFLCLISLDKSFADLYCTEMPFILPVQRSRVWYVSTTYPLSSRCTQTFRKCKTSPYRWQKKRSAWFGITT